MHLRVGLPELHRQSCGACAGHVEQRSGEVEADSPRTGCRSDQVDRKLTGAAADVEDPISRLGVGGGQEGSLVAGDGAVVELGVVGPVAPVLAVPVWSWRALLGWTRESVAMFI